LLEFAGGLEKMYEVRAKLSLEEFHVAENLIFESDGLENWNLYENFDDKGYWVQGIFEGLPEAKAGMESLQSRLEVRGEWVLSELADGDWKESYKDHFKPWAIENLHWAPVWLKDEYKLPLGHEAVWLDPGMAFGTGNHATTRLCVEQLIEFKKRVGEDFERARVVDAGCGSGILAISAAKLGFKGIQGFDIDEDAVRIAEENAALNGVEETRFFVGDLESGLRSEGADCLLANILANVLEANADRLADSVAEGGWLVLSGILGSEAERVRHRFEAIECLKTGEVENLDEWASIRFQKSARG
jgi:ribosomal protein L11 methyltransferase